MLKEAIEERRGDTTAQEKFEPEIDLQIDAYIPDSYISDGKQKIEMYKQFRAIGSIEERKELQDEMIDRFGEYPQEVADLFTIATMKVYAVQERVELIKMEKGIVRLTLDEKASSDIDGQKLFELGSQYGRDIGLGMEGSKLIISVQTKARKRRSGLKSFFVCFEVFKM